MVIKKVAAIHDLSGFGRCSLTVIIPILSVMGIQACPLPTAVLSTHTGGFDNMVFKDMTDFIKPCYEHYKNLGLEFDAVYSGFLASAGQIDCCLEFFRGFPNALKVVDPVMGDNGKTYKTYTRELCRRMRELAKIADIITPNLTEAAILLSENYTPALTQDVAEEWLHRLCEYSEIAVITGVREQSGDVYNIGLARNSGVVHTVKYKQIPAHFPGSGDIFTSVLTGAILQGEDLKSAIKRATEFSRSAVEFTYENGGESRNGVMFEGMLGELIVRKKI